MRSLSLVFAALLSLFILPRMGWAKPPIKIDKITSQCTNNVPSITVTLNSVSWPWGGTLYYHNPPSSPGTAWPTNTSTATFNVISAGQFQITDSEQPSTGIQSLVSTYTLASCGGTKKGMTWIHSKSDATTGTITVGCSGCDAYHGDTECKELRPLLCIYKPTPPFQLPNGLPEPTDNRWSGGVVATTEPVAGRSFTTVADANSYCKDKFGDGWRVAEFHDGRNGGIWNFQAYGGTVSAPTVPSTRFWVTTDDQPDGNCWTIPKK